jgi:hypothetical protein
MILRSAPSLIYQKLEEIFDSEVVQENQQYSNTLKIIQNIYFDRRDKHS